MTKHALVLGAGAAALALGICWLAGAGSAADSNGLVWKPFVPDAEYKTLVDQSIQRLDEILNSPKVDEKVLHRVHSELILVALLNQASPLGSAKLNAAVVKMGQLASSDDYAGSPAKTAELKKQVKALAELKGGDDKPTPVTKKNLDDLDDLMTPFKLRSRGGHGIEPKPSNPIADGIEAKVMALDKKRLTPTDLAKQADHLVLMAYKIAVIANQTPLYAPEKKVGDKDPKEWMELTKQMHESALQLAEAAKKKNPDAVYKASKKLNESCTTCHSKFRE
jgi:hypothetical protein